MSELERLGGLLPGAAGGGGAGWARAAEPASSLGGGAAARTRGGADARRQEGAMIIYNYNDPFSSLWWMYGSVIPQVAAPPHAHAPPARLRGSCTVLCGRRPDDG